MNRVDRHPEVVPDQDAGLDPAAVALPQGLHQLGVSVAALACSHCSNWSSTISTFWPGAQPRPRRSSGQRASTRPRPSGRSGTPLPQAFQQPGLGLVRRSPRRTTAIDASASRGQQPAFTSDDLPQPDGP